MPSCWGATINSCSSSVNFYKHNINYLENFAVLFSLESFHDRLEGWHINLMVDNTTAIATIIQISTCHSLTNKVNMGVLYPTESVGLQ